MSKNSGYTFWKDQLGSPRLILGPMVDQSELAWRLLGRKYGAELCYTPMLHASVFVKDFRYRKENLLSCSEDRPLVIQFCANDPDVFVEACKLAAGHCDAVDLNLGCPQAIARRGRYGAFLQEEWDLLKIMVSRVHNEVDIPVTCKIRVFEDIAKTVQYAQMLESAGCQVLTVHGRTKEQKGPLTGLASWEHIKAVKNNINIPVIANGNIQKLSDVERCFKDTGADAIMIAEGSLHNPALFKGLNPPIWKMANEYLDLVKSHPCPLSYVRGHIFKMCHHGLTLEENREIRQKIATANRIEEFSDAISELKNKYETLTTSTNSLDETSLPPWICQPYIRPPPTSKDTPHPIAEEHVSQNFREKRQVFENSMSRKKLKKLQKNPNKCFGVKKFMFEKCEKCLNPKGSKCSHQLCKSCCKKTSYSEKLDCIGHKFSFRSKTVGVQGTTFSKDTTTSDFSVLTVKDNIQESEICAVL